MRVPMLRGCGRDCEARTGEPCVRCERAIAHAEDMQAGVFDDVSEFYDGT